MRANVAPQRTDEFGMSKLEAAARAAVVAVTAKVPSAPWTFVETIAFGTDAIERYVLPNGLSLLYLFDDSAPVVTYHSWFNVGSRHEREGKTGLAHLFEHLMFNETKKLRAGMFDKKLEERGAESNASTWFDWTNYYESLPAADFGVAVALEAERMENLVLREPVVTAEKGVVMNERRMRVEDDIEGIANEVLWANAYLKHPYHWPTIGWMKDIEGFTPADCEDFYRTFYAPNNATVVVVGDVKRNIVLAKIASAYGHMPAAKIPAEDVPAEPFQREERVATLHKPTNGEKLLLGWKGPALGDFDHPAFAVLNEILTGGRAARLHGRLIQTDELATELRGWVSTFRDPGLYELWATARPGFYAGALLAAIENEIGKIQTDVPLDSEVERAKARLELALVQSLDTTAGKAEQIGFYEIVLGDPSGAFRRLERYRRVTASDVRTVARRYLRTETRTRIVVLPSDESPESQDAEEAAQ